MPIKLLRIPPRDDSYRLNNRALSRIENRGAWEDGDVITPQGIVTVMMQGSNSDMKLTRMDFACAGKLHTRTFHQRFSARHVVTLARKFAKEITNRKTE